MPKIIKDLREQIKKEAMEMFQTVGYEEVSMRKIASSVGTAVGTLYNYFPNKEALYQDILMESWQQTIEQIKSVVSSPFDKSQLEEAVRILYTDLEARKGLGKHIIGLDENSVFMKLFDDLEAHIASAMTALSFPYPERQSKMLIISTMMLHNGFKHQKNENLSYLYHMLKEE